MFNVEEKRCVLDVLTAIYIYMLKKFFQKFCMVEKIDFEDEDSKSAVVTFQSRDEAEKVI